MFEDVTLRWEGSDRVHYDVVQDRSSDWSFSLLFFFFSHCFVVLLSISELRVCHLTKSKFSLSELHTLLLLPWTGKSHILTLTMHYENSWGFFCTRTVLSFTCVGSSIIGTKFLDGETRGPTLISNLNITVRLKFVTSIIIPAQFWSWNTICSALKGSCCSCCPFFLCLALWRDSDILW